MMRTTADRLRPPPPTPEPLCEKPAAVDRLANAVGDWEQDDHQAVLPKPGLVLMVAVDGPRPTPPALSPLCVKEAAVNKPRPVPSSSFLPPSPLGPPPPPISYRGGDRGGGGRFAIIASAIRPAEPSPAVGGHERWPMHIGTTRTSYVR